MIVILIVVIVEHGGLKTNNIDTGGMGVKGEGVDFGRGKREGT